MLCVERAGAFVFGHEDLTICGGYWEVALCYVSEQVSVRCEVDGCCRVNYKLCVWCVWWRDCVDVDYCVL